MLEFSDAPYRFFPSKPSKPIIALSRWANRRFILPGKRHRISQITISGATENLASLREPGSRARILFVANHPTHSDPQTVTEIQRRLGIHSSCMAAYDVFLRSKFQAWILQRNGAFSIDRESGDRKAMAAAVEILTAGKFGLTIFPEGNVHFTNDRVTPFLDGASFVAVRAQKSLGDAGAVYAVPLALKFTHLTDTRPRILSSLSELARSVGKIFDPHQNPVDELMRIGRIILLHYLSRHNFISDKEGADLRDSGCLFETLNQSALRIISELEQKIGLDPKGAVAPHERIRRIRSSIHQILTNPPTDSDHLTARGWAAEAILALRILGYGTPYSAENPTLDRFAETVEKLGEDHLNHAAPESFGERAAIAHFGEPIGVSEILSGGSTRSRNAVTSLTKALESSIQSSLGTINASLSTPGSQPF